MKKNYRTFKVTGRNVANTTIIPVEDQIVEKNKDGKLTERSIRYVKGEPSIYKEDQGEYAVRRIQPLVMRKGLLVVSEMELSLIEYLDKCNYNVSNPNRKPGSSSLFEEEKQGADADTFIANETKSNNVKTEILALSASDVEIYAHSLGIRNVQGKLTNELRRDLLVTCVKDPNRFYNIKETFDQAKASHIVYLAEGMGEIRFQGQVVLLRGGVTVFECEYGFDVKQKFAEYLLTSKGKNIYATLHKAINPNEKLDVNVSTEPEVEEKPITVDELFEKAVDKELIIKIGKNFIYVDESGKEFVLGTNKKFSLVEIEANKKIQKELLEQV